MSGNNRKLFDNLVSRTKIYLVIIFILLLMVSILRPNLTMPALIIYILILGYTYFANNKRKSEISEQLQDLTLTVDSAAKSSLINAPFPLIIIETDEKERELRNLKTMNVEIYDSRKYGRANLIFLAERG